MKVIVGMSGGVDSSVAALLLKQRGFDVVGVFMKNYSAGKNKISGECSWRDEFRMAKRVAVLLDIPLKFIDYEKTYRRKVIEPMYRDYARGLTPNPDVVCNKIVKFPALFEVARKFGAEFVATGHYARVRKNRGSFELLRGMDSAKDQSYFLYELKQKELRKIVFPVGDLTKEQVREIARQNGLPNWDKKGTSGICFVGPVTMKYFLKKKIKEKRGDMISPDERLIGSHPGISFFTIGERVGERSGVLFNSEARKFGGKLYVAEKRRGNIIVVAPRGDSTLKRREIFVGKINFINGEESGKMKARVRHLGKLYSGRLIRKNRKWRFNFASGVEGVAEGQSVVLYRGERIVGGGEMRFRYNVGHK